LLLAIQRDGLLLERGSAALKDDPEANFGTQVLLGVQQLKLDENQKKLVSVSKCVETRDFIKRR